MASIFYVITVIMLIIVSVIVYKRKRTADRERLQEDDLSFFLSLGADGYSWNNVGRQETSSSFDSVPVLHRQTSSASYVPNQENHFPVETPGQRMHRFR